MNFQGGYNMSYEKTLDRLRTFASNGLLEIDRLLLLPSEFRLLKKEGLTVIKQATQNGSRNKVFFCNVSWKNAYIEEIPKAVSSYIHSQKAQRYPKEDIQNFAQELYVIAKKHMAKKF